MPCTRCGGRGYHYANVKNLGTLDMEEHIVSCMQPGCVRGTWDREEYYRIVG